MRVRIPVWLLAAALFLTGVAIQFYRFRFVWPPSGTLERYVWSVGINQWTRIIGTTTIMAIVAWLLLAGVVVSRLIQDRKSANTQVSQAAQEADPES